MSHWQQQRIDVQGIETTLGEVEGGKLYHGSPYELSVGTVLRSGIQRKNYAQSQSVVSITSEKHLAKYWGSLKGKTTGYVYEVEPLGEVGIWRAFWRRGPGKGGFTLDEGVVSKAKILRLVEVVAATKKKPELTPDQLEAVKSYASWAGRDWRKQFEQDWLDLKNHGRDRLDWPDFDRYWPTIKELMATYAWKFLRMVPKKLANEIMATRVAARWHRGLKRPLRVRPSWCGPPC